jgi:hypothetical protein
MASGLKKRMRRVVRRWQNALDLAGSVGVVLFDEPVDINLPGPESAVWCGQAPPRNKDDYRGKLHEAT